MMRDDSTYNSMQLRRQQQKDYPKSVTDVTELLSSDFCKVCIHKEHSYIYLFKHRYEMYKILIKLKYILRVAGKPLK
jgi:hypothetical protein